MKSDSPTSLNIAPATKNDSHDWSLSEMKRYLQCVEQHWLYRPTSPNIEPATKFWVQDLSEKSLNCFRQYKDDSTTFRAWSEDNPTIKSSSRTHRFGDLILVPSWRHILYGKIQHLALRLSPKISQNAAPARKSNSPTSPNTAPATRIDSDDCSLS